MKLAAISGVYGPFSDEDIRRVRELALVARAQKTAQPAKTGEPVKVSTRKRKAIASASPTP